MSSHADMKQVNWRRTVTKLTDQEIRIKLDVLAEAMGRFYHVHGVKKYDPHFRPDTDANDDYAVLEWMQGTYEPNQIEAAFDHQGFGHRWVYEIGNYAQAALDLINGEMDKCEDCAALKVMT